MSWEREEYIWTLKRIIKRVQDSVLVKERRKKYKKSATFSHIEKGKRRERGVHMHAVLTLPTEHKSTN